MKDNHPKNILNYSLVLLKLFLFFIAIFYLNRISFLFFFREKFQDDSLTELVSVFAHAYRLDIATNCYLMILPLFFLLLQQFTRILFFKPFIFIYCMLLLLATGFISVFDMGIYHDWNVHLNYRAINYLNFVQEAAAFSDPAIDRILTAILIGQVIIGFALMILFFGKTSFRFAIKGKALAFVLFNFFLIALLFTGMRGGIQQIPVNESSVYFSDKQHLNDAALNVQWNAAKKFLSQKKSLLANPFSYYDHSDAAARVTAIYKNKADSVLYILTDQKPNIVLFVLESFTADVIEQLGGDQGVTPQIDSLINYGILFTGIYASGYRTDQGLASVFSGFPATPDFSVAMQPDKYHGLSFLPKALVAAGYSTSFYYGGELDFANMNAFFRYAGIANLYDKSSYQKNHLNAKWGAHDEFVFNKQLQDMKSKQSPFFSVILSLSSHEPFEVPGRAVFPGIDVPSKFKNSCYYTDKCIGDYIRNAVKERWYNNTLFILVADHGHIYPRNRNTDEPARFHIPMLFFGNVIKPELRGTKINTTGMQSDLAATILSQLQLPYEEFRWSNNLLNIHRNQFAYFNFDNGLGWITPGDTAHILFDETALPAKNDSGTVKDAKSFLQILYDEYIRF